MPGRTDESSTFVRGENYAYLLGCPNAPDNPYSPVLVDAGLEGGRSGRGPFASIHPRPGPTHCEHRRRIRRHLLPQLLREGGSPYRRTLPRLWTGNRMMDSAEERFWARVDATGDCWLWTGPKDDCGYGRTGRPFWKGAHRQSWIFLVGPIGAGLELDHLCRVRHCVNPDHLEPTDHRTNVMRGYSFSVANAIKTHCPKGHPYDSENTYRQIGGTKSRVCRRCGVEAVRRYKARKAAC